MLFPSLISQQFNTKMMEKSISMLLFVIVPTLAIQLDYRSYRATRKTWCKTRRFLPLPSTPEYPCTKCSASIFEDMEYSYTKSLGPPIISSLIFSRSSVSTEKTSLINAYFGPITCYCQIWSRAAPHARDIQRVQSFLNWSPFCRKVSVKPNNMFGRSDESPFQNEYFQTSSTSTDILCLPVYWKSSYM